MIEFDSKTVKKYIIMLGLTDKKTLKQLFDEETVVRTVNDICKANNVAYSVKFQNGAYINNDGVYVNEKSLELVIIDQTDENVINVCKQLRAALNQECLLSTVEEVELHSVYEK